MQTIKNYLDKAEIYLDCRIDDAEAVHEAVAKVVAEKRLTMQTKVTASLVASFRGALAKLAQDRHESHCSYAGGYIDSTLSNFGFDFRLASYLPSITPPPAPSQNSELPDINPHHWIKIPRTGKEDTQWAEIISHDDSGYFVRFKEFGETEYKYKLVSEETIAKLNHEEDEFSQVTTFPAPPRKPLE